MFVACLKQRIFEKVIYLFTMSKIESKFQGLYKVKSINVPEPTPTHILRVKEHRMSSKPDAQHIYLQKITESHQYYRFSLCIYIHLWWTMDAFIRAIVIDVELSMQSAASNNNNNRKEVNKFQLFILKVIILNIRFFFCCSSLLFVRRMPVNEKRRAMKPLQFFIFFLIRHICSKWSERREWNEKKTSAKEALIERGKRAAAAVKKNVFCFIIALLKSCVCVFWGSETKIE